MADSSLVTNPFFPFSTILLLDKLCYFKCFVVGHWENKVLTRRIKFSS